MSENRLISLHPRLAAVVDGIVSVLMVWWIFSVTNPFLILAWFFLRTVWWTLLVNSVYYPPFLNRYKHLAALVICNIGATSFLIFSDASNINIAKFLAIAFPAISFWLIPARADSLSVMEKPHRRWKLFMTLFAVSGAWLAVYASAAFQIAATSTIALSMVVANIFVTGVSVWQWLEYGEDKIKKLFRSGGVMFLILLELSSVVYLWPIGYFVSSFLLTWIWYLLWLLLRFDQSAAGVDWKKQRFFLITNVVLIIIFLVFIVRWK